MSHDGSLSGRAYGMSVVIGAYAGVTLQMLAATSEGGFNFSEAWAIPIIILVYGLFALPFVALGLALFSLPATRLLRRSAERWWTGVIAALWGGVAGKLTCYAVDHLPFLGLYRIVELRIFDLGLIYGVPTGLAWWLLCRRQLASR